MNKGIQKFYKLNSCILKEVDHNPYLGFILSNDFKSGKLILTRLAKKRTLHSVLFREIFKKCLPECKKKQTAYVALVRSILEYAAVIWDLYLEKDIAKIEQNQRKAARCRISSDSASEKSAFTQCVCD